MIPGRHTRRRPGCPPQVINAVAQRGACALCGALRYKSSGGAVRPNVLPRKQGGIPGSFLGEPMKTIGWIDTHGCDQSFHCINRDENGKPVVCHSDDTVCEHTEHRLVEEE